MKTSAAIAVTALLAVLALAPPASAAGPSARLQTCDPTNFPNALVWLKVERTSCATGKETTRKMRAWMQGHLGQGETDEDGWFHHTIDGWNCKTRFVGGDEVIEKCKQPIPGTGKRRLIRAFFYID